MIQIPKEPQASFQVLSTGIEIWKGTISRALPFALIAAVLALLFSLYMYSLGLPIDQPKVSAETLQMLHPGEFSLAFLVYYLLICIINSSMIFRIFQSIQNNQVGFTEALGTGFKKGIPYIITIILFSVMVAIGLFLFIVPGVFISISFVFAPYLVIISGKGIIAAFRESYRLVSGNWWHSAVTIFVFTIALCVLALIILLLLGGIGMGVIYLFQSMLGTELGHWTQFIGMLVQGTLVIVLYPLFYSCMIALIHDLRVRKTSNTTTIKA